MVCRRRVVVELLWIELHPLQISPQLSPLLTVTGLTENLLTRVAPVELVVEVLPVLDGEPGPLVSLDVLWGNDEPKLGVNLSSAY